MHYCNTVLMYYTVVLSLYISIAVYSELKGRRRAAARSSYLPIIIDEYCRYLILQNHRHWKITSNIITAQHNNMIQCIVGIAPANCEIPVYYYLAHTIAVTTAIIIVIIIYKLYVPALETVASGFCANMYMRIVWCV